MDGGGIQTNEIAIQWVEPQIGSVYYVKRTEGNSRTANYFSLHVFKFCVNKNFLVFLKFQPKF